MSTAHAVGMKLTSRKARNDDSLFELVRVLVFVQVVIALISAIEASIVGVFMGAPGVAVVTGTAAILTAAFYVGLGRRSPRSRKWLIRFQVGWMAIATVDLLLAVFLAGRGLELVPLLTRIVLPYAIFRILRKPVVHAEFWPPPHPASQIHNNQPEVRPNAMA